MKLILDWCSDDGMHEHEMYHDKELFDDKDEALERLEELKDEFGEDLEYELREAKETTKTIWE
jgi:hypothetical protein